MISDAIGLRKLILKTKGSDGSKSPDETYFPAFQEPKFKNLRAIFWRGMLCLPSKTKTMKTEQEYCPFGQKGFFKYVSKEIFWKFTEVTSHLLIDVVKPIKNGHSREWMWHCYLDCPRLENRVFQDMHARVSKYHGRRNGKKCFFNTYSSSVTKANGNRSSESVFRWKLNHKIIPTGNLFIRFNL